MTDAVPEVSQVPEVFQVPEVKKDEAKKDEVEQDEVELNEYEFRVAMSCGGCSGAVTKALTNYNGGKIEVLEAIPVENILKVRTALPLEVVCDVIAMTRKKIIKIIEKPKVGEADAKTGKPILETIEKPKVGEPVAKNLVGEVAKQAPGPSPAA
ncbi:Cytosolic copper metallochaperone [Coemansia sp. RSA 922]|nr:hypothetical protein H4S03_002418 [Coemansia sp. S3946]KAJ2042774.1 hypothetical protein H4S04_007118 [Coemansia sp. S16]KAJ2055383.1 hypothetical protein GGI08_004166 [Coemansia sp. S2]KAJ2059796.1 hypothetical protein GGH13_006883 [Coemansia sp. S155-1]KAJ2115565.1 Cytosolic copper metallochaperone [Coemansia sp. RSA 922]KAJ2344715.1 hypothetical protein GGH92_004366 [Coemansia sp. RSA 2673]KAJ2426588.1 hypothetical protein GGF41_001998 [Coemansia sp. RSA 2531]